MKVRVNFFLLVCVCLQINVVKAQNIYLPKNIKDNAEVLDKEFFKISKTLLKRNKIDSTSNYYKELFVLQILAKDYVKAQKNIDNYIDAYTIDKLRTGRIFIYLLYSKAKLLQKNAKVTFDAAIKESFTKLYQNLEDYLKPEVIRSISNDIQLSEIKSNFFNELNKFEAKDSISLSQAKKLCILYNKYKVYSESLDLSIEALEAEDEKLFEIKKDIVIKTLDGVEVTALVISRKGVKKPLPSIFIYNIYAGSYDYEVAKRAALKGYVGVAVNTRGKRLSENDITPFEFDGEDAYHIIDWISKQKWCNGSIGMMGGSYLGFSQWSATKKLHPALKTIIPQVSVGIGIDYPMQNNIFMGYMLQWIHYVTNNKFTDNKDFGNYKKWSSLYDEWYQKGYSFRKLDSLANGKPNELFQRWLEHPAYDEFWKKMVPYKEEFKNIDIPILTTTGYYDDDQLGALYYFNEHYKYNPEANHYLLIGPYSHSGGQHYPTRTMRGYKIDDVALISMHKLAYQWFDYILKGKEKPKILKDKINYQIMGTNRWGHSPSFDKMNANYFEFYLSEITKGDSYKMLKTKKLEKDYISFETDLSVRNEDDTHNFSLNSTGSILSNEINTKNVLKFISKPFENDVTINGIFEGELNISINKKDVDILIQLFEMQLDGSYFFLSEYLGRASYAKNNEKRELLTPFQEYRIPIKKTFMTSKKINKGSKLVVLLSVNKSKHWEVNYGTGKPVSQESIKDAGVPLFMKLYNDSYVKIGYNFEN